MSDLTRILFVDDDAQLRKMWSSILVADGFEVKAASSVSDALALIAGEKFDVLLADLNIGQPGDGFTVVSAMRRTNPETVTLILTGYPAFDAALRAIHGQVDEFLVKPAEPENLIRTIRTSLRERKKDSSVLVKRLAQIVEDHKDELMQEWYEETEKDPAVKAIPLSREERIDHLPDVLDEVVSQQNIPGTQIQPQARDAAAMHGIRRRQQRYTIPMLLEETRVLHHVIAQCTHQNLLKVDISNLIPDLISMDDTIYLMLRRSAEAFLGTESKAA